SILPGSSSYVGSGRYRLLHKRYHNAYLELIKRADFDDILLVDINGNVAYSVFKQDNYGTNLLTGKYKDSNLGLTFQKLAKDVTEKRKTNEDYTPVIVSDFLDENGKQSAWLGAPIVQQGYLHSYAMFRLPINGITKLIADLNKSSNMQTLLVGSDHLPRSLAHSQQAIDLSLEVIDKALAGETAVGTFDNSSDQAIIA
ncbi:hybrid sensor histidine kinase/response regulator, partial [Vibrio sp. D173a]|nr:hybrid sensor histidine kinase/response regulator [Vibrio sp. D173a]